MSCQICKKSINFHDKNSYEIKKCIPIKICGGFIKLFNYYHRECYLERFGK